MKLLDRKRLATLMVIQEVSQRELAEAAGWSSHSFLGRLLRGEVDTLSPDAALRIAVHLQVAVNDLFVPRLSTGSGKNAKQRRAA